MGNKAYLEQKKTLLELHPVQKSEEFVYFQYEGDDDSYRVGYYLPRSDFLFMGSPNEITVVVQPGDHMSTELRDAGQYGELTAEPDICGLCGFMHEGSCGTYKPCRCDRNDPNCELHPDVS